MSRLNLKEDLQERLFLCSHTSVRYLIISLGKLDGTIIMKSTEKGNLLTGVKWGRVCGGLRTDLQ